MVARGVPVCRALRRWGVQQLDNSNVALNVHILDYVRVDHVDVGPDQPGVGDREP